MNMVIYALKDIRYEIPDAILIEAFTKNIPANSRFSISIDERIKTQVIKGKVLADLDVRYGIEEVIPLQGIPMELDNYYNAIFVIPFERTFGKEIISCKGVGTVAIANGIAGGRPSLPMGPDAAPNSSGQGSCGYNPSIANNELNRIYNSYGGIYSDLNASVTMLGPNTISVKGFRFYSTANLGAILTIANDENFNNVHPKSFPKISKLCSLACKAFIYKELFLSLEMGKLAGGQEMGRFDEIVSSYSTAQEDYDTYLDEVIGKVMFLNDLNKKIDIISTMMTMNL